MFTHTPSEVTVRCFLCFSTHSLPTSILPQDNRSSAAQKYIHRSTVSFLAPQSIVPNSRGLFISHRSQLLRTVYHFLNFFFGAVFNQSPIRTLVVVSSASVSQPLFSLHMLPLLFYSTFRNCTVSCSYFACAIALPPLFSYSTYWTRVWWFVYRPFSFVNHRALFSSPSLSHRNHHFKFSSLSRASRFTIFRWLKRILTQLFIICVPFSLIFFWRLCTLVFSLRSTLWLKATLPLILKPIVWHSVPNSSMFCMRTSIN